MTRATVRPMSDDDDLVALDAGNLLAWMTDWWRTLPELEFHWFVGLLDDRPVGLGAVGPLPIAPGGCGAGLLNVVPQARRQGVATALRRTLEDEARGRVRPRDWAGGSPAPGRSNLLMAQLTSSQALGRWVVPEDVRT